jgi:putative DNA primase/helicase
MTAKRDTTLAAATVRDRARGQWIWILGRLAPTLERALARPGRHVPCPVHGGRDGFRVFRDCADTGGGICNTCGSRSDGFALLMWANDWGFRETLEAVARDLRLDTGGAWTVPSPRREPAPAPAPRRDAQEAEAALRRVWSETLDPRDPAAQPLQRYLRYRGIDAQPDPRVVRFHPGLGYFDADGRRLGIYPALVARVSNAAGRPVTLHRIYLARDGRKAPVESPKKLMTPLAPIAGGAIRLYPPGATLGITEGLETALVVRQRTGMAVWCGISAALLERFEPPPGVSLVVVWADLDVSGAGERAALGLRERLSARGLRSVVHVPRGPIPAGAKGLDWADLWRLKGEALAA